MIKSHDKDSLLPLFITLMEHIPGYEDVLIQEVINGGRAFNGQFDSLSDSTIQINQSSRTKMRRR